MCQLGESSHDSCLEDNFGGSYVFQKVKALKKPGKGTPLHGWYHLGKDILPIAGSAVVGSDGTMRAAVTIYEVGQGAVSIVMGWTGDATLAGTGDYDNNDSGSSSGSIVLTSVNCKTVTLP